MTDDELLSPTSPPAPVPPPGDLILTDEQNLACEKILAFTKQRFTREFKLGGYAGTGKTTVIKHLLKILKKNGQHVIVLAFTGKAVNVLQRKGVMAQTMHSAMYECEVASDGTCEFFKRSTLMSNPTAVIVDESSMVSTDLYQDLISFGKLVIFVGDPGQLEPVGDNPNLMATPDLVLSKIHRQAELSPIITLASNVRLGGPIQCPHSVDGLSVLRKSSANISEAVLKDQIICATNKVRINMNDSIRLHKEFHDTLVIGEKLIVLKNNPTFGVFNGMIVFIDEIKKTTAYFWDLSLHDETGRKLSFRMWRGPFESPELRQTPGIPPRDDKGSQLVLADYGYAITCHKSQGSEWDKVVVFDQWMPPKVWDVKRWRYTAITRAAKELTLFM